MSAEEIWHRRRRKTRHRRYCSMCVHSDSESDVESSTFEDEDVHTSESQRHPRRRQSYRHCRNCLRPHNAFSDDESDLEPPNVNFLPSHSKHGRNEITISGGTNSAVGRDQTIINNNTLIIFGENSSSALAFSIGFFTSSGLFGQGDSLSRRCL